VKQGDNPLFFPNPIPTFIKHVKPMVTQSEATQALSKVRSQIMTAVKDYNNNPEKAEPYILVRIDKLFEFAVEYGRANALDDIFNGDCFE
jgi:hypothetical protein